MGQRGGCHVVYVFAADTRDGMPQSERVMADVRLGVTVAGLYTLVGSVYVKGRLMLAASFT
jgi:hypothetical protein